MGSCCSIFTKSSRKNRRASVTTGDTLIREHESTRAGSDGNNVEISEVENPMGYSPPGVPAVQETGVSMPKRSEVMAKRASVSKVVTSPAGGSSHSNIGKPPAPSTPATAKVNNSAAAAAITNSSRRTSVRRASTSAAAAASPGQGPGSVSGTPKVVKPTVDLSKCAAVLPQEVLGESLLHPPPPENIYIRGYILKRGHRVRNWKKRYMVLDKREVRYYVKDSDRPPYGTEMKGQVDIAFCRLVHGMDGDKQIMEVVGGTTDATGGGDKDLYLTFADAAELQKWTLALQWAIRLASIEHLQSPFHTKGMVLASSLMSSHGQPARNNSTDSTSSGGASSAVTGSATKRHSLTAGWGRKSGNADDNGDEHAENGSKMVHRGEWWLRSEKLLHERHVASAFYGHNYGIGRRHFRVRQNVFSSNGKTNMLPIDVEFFSVSFDDSGLAAGGGNGSVDSNNGVGALAGSAGAERLADCGAKSIGFRWSLTAASSSSTASSASSSLRHAGASSGRISNAHATPTEPAERQWHVVMLDDITDMYLGILPTEGAGVGNEVDVSVAAGRTALPKPRNVGDISAILSSESVASIVRGKFSCSLELSADSGHREDFESFVDLLGKLLLYFQISSQCNDVNVGRDIPPAVKSKRFVAAQELAIRAVPSVSANRRMLSSLA